MLKTRRVRRGVLNGGCVLAFVFASIAGAQNTRPEPATPTPASPPASEKPAEVRQDISYVDGQLKIDALNSTLVEVLAKVSALTGVKIDLPEGASAERMPVLQLGPGPAREILADLLRDSDLDYLILASAGDAEKIESVVLMPRGKKDSGSNLADAARPLRSPYSRAALPPRAEEPAPPPEPPAPVPPENTVADATPSNNAQPLTTPPDPSASAVPAQPDLSAQPTFGQPLKTNVPATFPVAPPSTMNQQSISVQLQQMYQQRMQMNQQIGQAGQLGTPGNPTNK